MIDVLSCYNINFIHKFWVGLMDGDGSLQVNHWRKQSLQFRLIIKLKFLESNENMLNILCSFLGGHVRYIFKQKVKCFVIWVVNDKTLFIKILRIFDVYKPLTSRLLCQLEFAKKCLQLPMNDIKWYFENRNLKYKEHNNQSFKQPFYFDVWLVGFIEAEGCFCTRNLSSKNISFSIGQNNDYYLLLAIKNYFNGVNKIIKRTNNFFVWEVYNKSVLLNIVNHCSDVQHPLLGAKMDSLKLFIKFLN